MNDTVSALLAALEGKQWVAAGALAIGLLVALAKQGWLSTKIASWLPPKYIPYEAMALGVLGVSSAEILAGKPIVAALIDGVMAGMGATAAHEIVIQSARSGKEFIPATPAVQVQKEMVRTASIRPPASEAVTQPELQGVVSSRPPPPSPPKSAA
jgi:hypothetical protein